MTLCFVYRVESQFELAGVNTMKKSVLILLMTAFLSSQIMLTAGCVAQPSSDTSLSTHEQYIAGSLPKSVIGLLGSGFNASKVFLLAGLPADAITAGHYRFLVNGDDQAICDLQIIVNNGTPVIKTAIVSDTAGHKLMFSPVPDSRNINDYQIVCNGKAISLGSFWREEALVEVLGEPLETIRRSDAISGITTLTCVFDGLALTFSQPGEPADPDSWLLIAMTCSADEYANPRGLQPGLSYRDAISLLGTGDFIVCPDQLPYPTRLTVCKTTVNNGSHIELTFENQIVTAVTLSLSET